MTLHNFSERVDNICSLQGVVCETQALADLLDTADRIVFNTDGLHGVCREAGDAKKLLLRASRENGLFLDLGHLVRIYFGDDYFDVYLDTKVSRERPAALSELVEAAKKEREQPCFQK